MQAFFNTYLITFTLTKTGGTKTRADIAGGRDSTNDSSDAL